VISNHNGHKGPRRVLVTGHQGYIGSVMVPHLLHAGYSVVGLDTGYFRSCTFVPDAAEIPTLCKDIRELELRDLDGFDAVIHLAALSNDPIGNLNERWTEEINFRASLRLAELARAAGVSRFLFSSSCIMYGMSATNEVNEESSLAPQTEYARSKVKTEIGLRELAREGFSPTYLRNGTVYGLSPRMRFDTVFNDLVGAAVSTGQVLVYSDGKPWRPVVHVQDVSRAFLTILEAPLDSIHNQAFNIGANHLNHQIIDLARIVVKTVPNSQLEIQARRGADQRTYKTDFGKFARAFPEFQFLWDAEAGARELYHAFKAQRLTHESFIDKKFTRLKWLRYLLESGQLDASLRWQGDQQGARHD
jgi:nucleoside-diphosphate-sugar epimerase